MIAGISGLSQICTRVPSSTTQLWGNLKKSATLPALRDIVAKHLPGTDAKINFTDEYPAMSPTAFTGRSTAAAFGGGLWPQPARTRTTTRGAG